MSACTITVTVLAGGVRLEVRADDTTETIDVGPRPSEGRCAWQTSKRLTSQFA